MFSICNHFLFILKTKDLRDNMQVTFLLEIKIVYRLSEANLEKRCTKARINYGCSKGKHPVTKKNKNYTGVTFEIDSFHWRLEKPFI